MTYKVTNIIIGAAAIYLSVKDSSDASWAGGPALPTGTPGATLVTDLNSATTDWRHAGFTSEGLEVSYEPDFGDVEVDQLLDSAKLFKQSMRVTVNTTFTEATLENLLIVWGQQSTSRKTTGTGFDGATIASGEEELGLSAGALGDEPTERALVAVGPSPRSSSGGKRERVYHARRVLSVESSSHSLRRNEATVFPVSFRLLPDPTHSGAEYGLIRDRNLT